MTKLPSTKTGTAVWLLRAGLAFVFLYAAISSLEHPLTWAGYLPNILLEHIDPQLLVRIFAIYELLLTAWLLSGKYARYAALLTAVTLGGIIVSDLASLVITFRDVGLFFMALALAYLVN